MTLVTMINHHHHHHHHHHNHHNHHHNHHNQQQHHQLNHKSQLLSSRQHKEPCECDKQRVTIEARGLLHLDSGDDGGGDGGICGKGCLATINDSTMALEVDRIHRTEAELQRLSINVAGPRRQHKNSTASSTTDQYSSLNLSSLASSSSTSSSTQHSPLLIESSTRATPADLRQQQQSAPISMLDVSHNSLELTTDTGLEPKSCESAQCQPDDATKLFSMQARNPHRLSTISGTNLLQPTGQKVRSFSHSNTFCPLLTTTIAARETAKQLKAHGASNSSTAASSPACSSGRHSAASTASSCLDDQQQQTNQLEIVPRPRRPSRIEQRQSLHELGYGKIESYFKLQRLGKGTYATVYMGRSRLSNDLVALKEILKEHDEGAPCTAIREVSLLRLLRHNNIVTLHDICHTPKKLTLVFEYVGPDLYAYMKENNNLLSIHNVRLLLYQLLRGISFCHSRQVLHRDLKPQNLLINSRGELKICDFGLARAKSIPTKSYSNEVVTLWYRPPDVLLGNTDYDHSIDMWGVGCIFYEMASGRTFFPGSNVRQQLYLIFSSLGAPNRHNWPEILQNPEYQSYSFPSFRPEKLAHRLPRLDSTGILLLTSFLRFKPSERISADEARRDPFFASLPEQIHHLSERESIFDVPGVYMTLNPGQKMNHHHM